MDDAVADIFGYHACSWACRAWKVCVPTVCRTSGWRWADAMLSRTEENFGRWHVPCAACGGPVG